MSILIGISAPKISFQTQVCASTLFLLKTFFPLFSHVYPNNYFSRSVLEVADQERLDKLVQLLEKRLHDKQEKIEENQACAVAVAGKQVL